jgi:hypothetical protein
MSKARHDKAGPTYPSPVTDIGSIDEAVEVYRRVLEPTNEERELAADVARRVAQTRSKLKLD